MYRSRLVAALLLLPAAPAPAQEPPTDRHSHSSESVAHSHRGPGPHFIDAFHTENAYLERKVQPDVSYLSGDHADLVTATLEIEWALFRRLALIVHAPMHSRSSAIRRETGVGDLSLGVKVPVVLRPSSLIIAAGADLVVPTGDEDRGLGAGHAAAEPFVLAWLPFGPDRRWLIQTAGHLDMPLAGDEPVGAEVAAALSWTSPFGITPLLEGIGEFPVEGDGGPTWWLAPGVRWEFLSAWETGASLRVGVSGPEVEDGRFQVTVGLIRHYPPVR
jgi:hypothetical protein